MLEDEPGELSASTSERFFFMMTPDMMYDSAALSLKVIHKEQRRIRKLMAELMHGMSVRAPSGLEWQRANAYLVTLTEQLEVLAKQEIDALRSFTELCTHHAT